jgi:hypothetical protein
VAHPCNGGSLFGNRHQQPKRGHRSLPSLASEYQQIDETGSTPNLSPIREGMNFS